MSQFLGRQDELQRLQEAKRKKTASFIVVKGRRRIGKSRLIEEFGKEFEQYYCFSGIPPTDSTASKSQLLEFSGQLSKNFHGPMVAYQNWRDAFWALTDKLKSGKILLLFDEISWMGSKDPDFLGQIKNMWDLALKKNDSLIFVICGSASSWIEKNILSSTGFLGRISFALTLRELNLEICSQFWPDKISNYEKLKVLSVTGGIPKYLEEINPHKSAEDNIKKLCFTDGGLLVEEYDRIFSDIFLRESSFYKKILLALSLGAKGQTEIQDILGLNTPGRLSQYLWELELAGFVARDYTWNIKTGEDKQLSKYRLQDNYLRFYLKYIQKNRDKIRRGAFSVKTLTALPEWNSIMGLQFENLVLNNRALIQKALELRPEDVICENPYFQNATTQQLACQIDYLIKTKFDTLYVCEIKFSRSSIGTEVIPEVQQKIERIKYNRQQSCRPVLIHASGTTKELVEADYFASIIDIGDFLKKPD